MIVRMLNEGIPFAETFRLDDAIGIGATNVMSVSVIGMNVHCQALLICSATYSFNTFDAVGAEVPGAGWIELQNGTNDLNNVLFTNVAVAPAMGFQQRLPRLSASVGNSTCSDLNWLITNFYALQGFVGVLQASGSIYAALAGVTNVYHNLHLAGFYL
jgi:hypothetical protein